MSVWVGPWVMLGLERLAVGSLPPPLVTEMPPRLVVYLQRQLPVLLCLASLPNLPTSMYLPHWLPLPMNIWNLKTVKGVRVAGVVGVADPEGTSTTVADSPIEFSFLSCFGVSGVDSIELIE